ncbi:MAG: replication-associated recombination protein A [Venatoribacter sp.]
MHTDLFAEQAAYEPLAAQMRPTKLEDYVGQKQVVGEGTPLRRSLETGYLHSLILWGPPGVGKTTLAKLLANYIDAAFITISAVMSGVKEIREAVQEAKQYRAHGRKTILFIDEVHRFNKSQQDAFLPYVEDGTFIFIGATTENPSFELNNALLSRAQVLVLKRLEPTEIKELLERALARLNKSSVATKDALELLAVAADGDARRSLNMLEIGLQLAGEGELNQAIVKELMGSQAKAFDKGGDIFYEQISALHKSVRGSSPDAALYWLVRMLEGGCDARYLARRIVRMAWEDIGLADPRAMQLCNDAATTYERLGSPEGELALAQAVLYLASAPKSNAGYNAYKQMRELVKNSPSYEVPVHLRNAPTKLMDTLGYGSDYRYAHDEPEAYAAGENYFPPELQDTLVYQPVARGLEIKIGQKLEYLNGLNLSSHNQRYKGKK